MRDPRATEYRVAAATLALLAATLACGGPDEPDLAVVLEPAEGGRLEIVVTNAGATPIRFLDVREGSSLCGAFWQVDVQLRAGTTLGPLMAYERSDVPFLVSLQPGETYRRPIHPAAYVEPHRPSADETAIVTVRYRVRNPGRWRRWIDDATLTFTARPLVVRLADFM